MTASIIKFRNFSDLLVQGRRNFDSTDLDVDNITGLEEGTMESRFVEQLRDLNNYMYTTYSTNRGCKVLSLEGIIPSDIFKKIEPKLLQQGYWYIAANPFDDKVHGVNLLSTEEFDPSMDKQTKLVWIDKNDQETLSAYYRWTSLCSTNKETLLINKDINIHFFPANDGSLLLKDYVSNETLRYTDETLYQGDNPLIAIVIEDPIVGRISLYAKLYQFLVAANVADL